MQSPSPAPTPDGHSGRRSHVTSIAALAVAALLGGGAALGGAVALNAFEDDTTTVVERPGSSARPVSASEALTPGEIYKRSSGAVVQVTTSTGGSAAGQGSGFVFDEQGHIVTNFHVVDGADAIEVSFSNRDTLTAEVVGTDASTDLALLEVDADATALTPLQLADSDAVKVGDPVVAIGNPFGLERTITAGIVSALQRTVQAPNDYTIDHVIQTDAPINPGNSGGPLLDAAGKVIGVNSQIQTGGSSNGNVGIGFAVPSNTVQNVVAQLLEDGTVDRSYIGVTLQDVDAELARAFELPDDAGVLVQSVEPGSPAADAGLRGGDRPVVVDGRSATLGGDLIVAIDGVSVANLSALRDALLQRKPGDRVELEVYRGDERQTIDVTLGQQPASR